MNLTIERAPALAALSRLVGVVERKNTIPILSNFALSASEGTLRLRATDLDMEAIETIAADVSVPGDITIPAYKLHDIVRNAEGAIAISQDALRMIVKSGRSRFNVPGLSIEDFPQFPAAGLGGGFAFPAKTLADMLSRVAFSAAVLEVGSAISCVYLASSGAQLHAVACSSEGMALRREPLPASASVSAILPMKFVKQVTKWLADAEGDCQVSSSENLIRLEHGGSVLTSKLFDAPGYIQYLDLLLDAQPITATTDQDALSAAIRRVLIIGESHASLRFAFADGAISIHARGGQGGEAVDEVAADYDGPEVSFLLPPSRLQETLSVLRGDRVEVGFSVDPSLCASPQDHHKVLIRAPADPAFTSIAMQRRA